jgi:RimJ/RimL family protein N-acetyltransferase
MTADPTTLPGGTPPLMLIGELVALGPVHRGLVPLFWKWESDLELSLLTGDPARPLTPEGMEVLYEHFSKAGDDHTGFAIYERASLRPIGTVGLTHINAMHRTAELGIGIGEHDCWGKGYGTEATRLVLDYAFTMLGLHNVMLRVFSYNERAIQSYLRAGFREIGRRREAQRIGDRAYDVVFMDCLAADFAALMPPRLQPPTQDTDAEATATPPADDLPEIVADLDAEDDLGA